MVEPVRLKRQLTLFQGVTIICGLVIGSGIYVAPKGVLLRCPSVGISLIIWVIGGVLSLLGALSFAELGTTFPSGGEKYHYLEQTYGPLVAFLYLWAYLMMLRPGANAIKCLTFGQYIVKPFYPDCPIPESSVLMMAICLAMAITALNCRNVGWAAGGQSVFSSLGILALLVICVTGISYIAMGKTDNLKAPFETPSTDLGDLSLAVYAGIFAYWGWNALNFMIEELKDPYRNLPLAIIISMAIVMILYVAVNVSYLAILGVEGVLQSEAVAVSFAHQTMRPMTWIMPVLIAFNTAGSFNSGTMVSSRLTFIGARRRHLPDVLGLIHIKYLTPMTALLFQLVLVVLLMSTVELYTLFNNLTFANTAFEVLNLAGLLWYRYKKPDIPRPIKMPLIVPVLFLLCMLALTIFPLLLKPWESGIGCLIILCTGVPYYVIFVLWQKPIGYRLWVEKQTIRVQKLLYSAREETIKNNNNTYSQVKL